MPQKMDLRIQKTYLALTTSLFQLLEKKSLEDITVKELCDLSMVRRATFYKHFGDKYEFGIFIIRQLQTEFYESNSIPPNSIRSKSYYIEVLQHSVTFLFQNKKLIVSILQSNQGTSLTDVLSSEISSNLSLKLQEDLRNGATLPAHPDIIANFFTGALIQTIRWWVMQKDPLSREDFMTQITSLLTLF